MADISMLICAAVGSMAFGILAAYGILRVAFSFLRPQRKAVTVKARPEIAL